MPAKINNRHITTPTAAPLLSEELLKIRLVR
jgi:hypothetical protein